MRRRWAFIGIAMATLVVVGLGVRRDLHGLTLVIRAADLQGPARRFADLDTVPVRERLVDARIDATSIRVRVYVPLAKPRQTVLLVSGLHPAGIDEPRLVFLARQLAAADVVVATPDIPELSRYEITPALTDRIERLALWLADDSALAPTGRIGLMGVSFSGGLAVVAAGRPALRGRLLYVFSFGGHDDLPRVLDYFCTAESTPPPHDYGVAVVLLNVAGELVPPEQVEPLRVAIRRFLQASYLDRIDKPRADAEFAALRAQVRTLPEPAATLLDAVNRRDVGALGPRLRPHLARYVEPAALSPSRSPAPSAPIFLLHGRGDRVIPTSESEFLAARLGRAVPVRLLVTDLISHAEADQPPHLVDVLKLADFWGDLLAR
jgi:dienelactone hydrolase